MAKKQGVNKSQAVRDYVKTHRDATSREVAEALTNEGIKVTRGYVSNIKTALKHRRAARARAAQPAAGIFEAAAVAVGAAAEKPAKPAEMITLEQIKKVAQTVQMMGGFERLRELLEVVREVGGLRKFKDLLDAMSAPVLDDIPF